jgi:Mce-associated membrane protein
VVAVADAGERPQDSAKAKADALALAEQAEAEAAEAEALAAAARARARAIKLRREAQAQADKDAEDATAVVEAEDTTAETSEAEDTTAETSEAEDTTAETSEAEDSTAETSETPQPSKAPKPPAESTESTRRRLRVPGLPGLSRLLTAAAILAICGLLGASGWMLWHHHTVLAERQRSAAYTAAARQGVVNLTSLDFNKAKEDVQRVLDSATGEFRDDFQRRADDFASVVKDSKAVTQGSVAASAVESMGKDSAVVLVLANERVTNSAGAKDAPRAFRFRVSVVRDGDQLKISKVEFVL